MASQIAKAGFVFTIGITGHRDIHPNAIADARTALSNELEALRSRFASLPIELVTGLAEGADTLAAEVALEMGIPVRAVLPMPRTFYEADFDDVALERFSRFASDDRVTLQELPLPDEATGDDFSEGSARDELYRRLMNYLVRRSNVLIALWDGEVTGLTGGSSDVVVRYLSDSELKISQHASYEIVGDGALADDRSDLVIWIEVPRQSDEMMEGEVRKSYLVQAGTAGLVCRLPDLPGFVLERWRGFENYAFERDSEFAINLPAYPLSVTRDSEISEVASSIDKEFVRADQLALANQLQSDRLFKLFALMAALMGLAFLLYAKIAALKWFLVSYVALFAAGFILFAVSARRGWFGRHLAFRALAEVLRVRFFLVLSGSGATVPTRRLLRLTNIERFKGFGWIGDAIRCTEPLTYESSVSAEERIEAASDRWIKDQGAYFMRKHHQLHGQHERLEYVKKFLFVAAFLGAASLLFFKKTLYGFHIGDLDGKTLIVFLMGLLPLWLAIWEIYQTKMATRELLWQYSNQGELFKLADRRLTAISDPALARDVISDLAARSLMDVIQWCTHRYHREHEPPSAG